VRTAKEFARGNDIDILVGIREQGAGIRILVN
jgi:hypothetical protein